MVLRLMIVSVIDFITQMNSIKSFDTNRIVFFFFLLFNFIQCSCHTVECIHVVYLEWCRSCEKHNRQKILHCEAILLVGLWIYFFWQQKKNQALSTSLKKKNYCWNYKSFVQVQLTILESALYFFSDFLEFIGFIPPDEIRRHSDSHEIDFARYAQIKIHYNFSAKWCCVCMVCHFIAHPILW